MKDEAIKPGYKRTEVGMIPEDWKVATIGQVAAKVGSGLTPTGGSDRYRESGRPFVRSQNIGWGRLLLDELTFIDEETHQGFAATELMESDVLLNITGASIGRTALASQPLAGGNVNQHVCIIRPASGVGPPLVNLMLLSSIGQRQIASFQTGGNRQGLNFAQIRSISIPLPPTLAEQEAIAGALGDADALIESLEKLVAKKRLIKQGAMQELLTGKKRLPGFSGEWRRHEFGDLFEALRSGNSPRSDLAASGEIGYLHYGDIHRHPSVYFDCSEDLKSYIAPAKVRNAARMANGDIVMVDASEDTAAIGKAVEATGMEGRIVVAGLHTILLRPRNALCAGRFAGYLQFFREVRSSLVRLATGVSVYGVSRTGVMAVAVTVPNPREQTAIAAVLSDMDAEIAALEAKLTKARQIKQGMMQELLTGNIRLVAPQSAASEKRETVQRVAAGATARPGVSHPWEFNEAVVIAVLAKHFGSEKYPLGRFRYTKLSYLLHRHVEHEAKGYRKMAAGPYNPSTRYAGPEKIARQNKYMRPHNSGTRKGFIAAENVVQAEAYFDKWYGVDALQWLEQFRFRKNDELEVLATVDMAMQDLRAAATTPTPSAVKMLIRNHPEWKAKLDRPAFADGNIKAAIDESGKLFG